MSSRVGNLEAVAESSRRVLFLQLVEILSSSLELKKKKPKIVADLHRYGPCALRFSTAGTWSLSEVLKWNAVLHVNITRVDLLQKHSHHSTANNFSYALKHKTTCMQDNSHVSAAANLYSYRNVNSLARNLPSPHFSLKEWFEIKHSPPAAIGLGMGGLIPFISAPTYLLFQGAYCPDIAFAQLAYGACILAFLGGIKWGCAIGANTAEKPTWTNLGLSTIPSLTAWVGLLVPQQLGVIVLATGITAATYVDLVSVGYPSWFKALRVTLSSVAITTLILMLILSLVQKKEKENKEIKENIEKQ